MQRSPSQPNNLQFSKDQADNKKPKFYNNQFDGSRISSLHNNFGYNKNVYIPDNDIEYRAMNEQSQSSPSSSPNTSAPNSEVLTPDGISNAPPNFHNNFYSTTNQSYGQQDWSLSNNYQQNFAPMHSNEIENRTLLISNLNPSTTLEEIKSVFDSHQLSKTIDTTNLAITGSITIEFFDLREAQNIKKTKNGIMFPSAKNVSKGPISVVYAPLKTVPNPKRPPNNGTIVVFHLPNGITDQHIDSSFSSFGEIREIRGTPQKPGQRFIEFWDTRAAEDALNNLNGKLIMGSKVSIEFSLPGGFRKNFQRSPAIIQNNSLNRSQQQYYSSSFHSVESFPNNY